MDMYKLLMDDHKKVKGLFAEALKDKQNIPKDVVKEICNELLLHMEKEEKFLYPILLELPKVEDLGEEAVEEHKAAKMVIEELQKGKLSTAKLAVKVEILKLEIEHHVEEEEEELFPKLKKILPKDRTDEIGSQMDKLKAKKLAKV